MKPLRLAAFCLTAASILASGSSCTSDQNPFDAIITPSSESNVAKIRLALDVAATRAEDDLSTADEKKVTKVSVYVFDEHDQLEKFKTDLTISSDSPAELEVTPGQKTVYAIASKTMISSTISAGTSLEDFEKTVFSSTLSNLKTNDGFVMVGKSEPQQVLKSANENEVPTSNVFNIELVRLLAKAQVKCSLTMDASDLGFTIYNPTFRISQTNDKMRLVADRTTDIISSYVDTDGNGTYDGYTVCPDNEFKMSVSDFTANGCHYLTENFVQSPVAGNTTFVSFCATFMPKALYKYDASSKILSTTPNGISVESFYAVAVVDDIYGFEDFALDPDNHHVLAFETKDYAEAYISSINVGEASAITVSETDTPLRAPASETYDVNHRQFQPVCFDMGRAYYRINITTGESNFSVVRNKFYKIDVKSITNLGFHSEDLLRPKDPTSDPGNSTSAWIETVLTVAPWEEVKQDTNL